MVGLEISRWMLGRECWKGSLRLDLRHELAVYWAVLLHVLASKVEIEAQLKSKKPPPQKRYSSPSWYARLDRRTRTVDFDSDDLLVYILE